MLEKNRTLTLSIYMLGVCKKYPLSPVWKIDIKDPKIDIKDPYYLERKVDYFS